MEMFREQTSSKTLSTFTCAVCGDATLNSTQCSVPIENIDLKILKWENINSANRNINEPPLPINDGPLKVIMLDLEGVVINPDEKKKEKNYQHFRLQIQCTLVQYHLN
jgi:hypothetical protein